MEQFERARHILENNRERVETLTAALLERETIDAPEFNMVMQGQDLPEPEIEVDHSSGEEEDAAPPQSYEKDYDTGPPPGEPRTDP